MTWIVFVCNIDLYTGTVNKYVPQMSPFTFDFITFDDKRLQWIFLLVNKVTFVIVDVKTVANGRLYVCTFHQLIVNEQWYTVYM